jgi:S-adenosylmethionine decarboxylase
VRQGDDQALSTIHVTPEDGFSYASYEVMGFNPGFFLLWRPG